MRLSEVLYSQQARTGIIEYALVLPGGALSQLSLDYDSMLSRAKRAWPDAHDDVTPRPHDTFLEA